MCDVHTERCQPGALPDLQHPSVEPPSPSRWTSHRLHRWRTPAPGVQMPRDPKLILNRIVTLCLVKNPRQAKPLTSQEPMVKTRTLVGQDEILDLGKQGRRRRGRQRMRRLDGITNSKDNGHEFEQTPGDSEGQGGRACCSPWGPKESDPT